MSDEAKIITDYDARDETKRAQQGCGGVEGRFTFSVGLSLICSSSTDEIWNVNE